MDDFNSIIRLVLAAILPVLFAITAHEAAHGWVAWKLGDPTAKLQGRVSFNPIRHIDPFGTIILPMLLLVVSKLMGGGVLFGWAKPVPVSWEKLNNPRRDMALVAVAGPGSNLIMAFLWALLAKLTLSVDFGGATEFVQFTCVIGVYINIILMVLNLLPVPPLDGGRIVHSLLPARWAESYAGLEPYGIIIILVLLFTGVLWHILLPMINGVQHLIWTILGVNWR